MSSTSSRRQPQTFECPFCRKSLVLKGAKLRTWLYKKDRKPEIKGPFCNHVCSRRYASVRAYEKKFGSETIDELLRELGVLT